jgi:fatty-acyl-CoA synthase
VGIWSHNNAPWVLMSATAKVGIVLVNINPAYRTRARIRAQQGGVQGAQTMKRFKTSDYSACCANWRRRWRTPPARGKRLPHLRTVVDRCRGQGRLPGLLRFSTLLDSGTPDDPQVAAIAKTLKATDPINIQFTSGTTGFPKGATLTHRNILNNGFFIGECMKLSPVDRLCIPVPLYHCFGMVLGNLACITHGSTIVYPNDGFDPITVLQTVQDDWDARHGARHVHREPTIRVSRSSISPRCAPASWPARRARPK